MGNRGTGALARPATSAAMGATEAPLARLDAARVLLGRARRAVRSAERPTIVFDVDDTLFRTAHRSLRILDEWCREPENGHFAPHMPLVALDAVGYGIHEALATLGVPEARREHAWAYWRERFFTSQYVRYDMPYAGAVDYVRAVHGLGCGVVYLTGRHMAMEAGTIRALVDHGFPWTPDDASTRLVLKPDQAMDDAAYKAEQFAALQAAGPILGALDNEPANVNLFHRLVPEAMAIFIDHPHSPNAPALAPHVYRIAGFPAL